MIDEEMLIPYHSSDLTGKRVLVFAPHPDDETIGCGGSLTLHVAAGDPVKVVFLTNGVKGDMSGKMEQQAYVALRRKEAACACACLGVTDLEFWSYEDRALAGSAGVLQRIVDLLQTHCPELVYVPSLLEPHPDHRAACFLLCDAIHSIDKSFEVAFYEVGQPLSVSLLVDITGVLDRKLKAINAYQSQLEERPYGDICIALNRYRSLTLPKGVTHAEGFSLWETGLIRKITCERSNRTHLYDEKDLVRFFERVIQFLTGQTLVKFLNLGLEENEATLLDRESKIRDLEAMVAEYQRKVQSQEEALARIQGHFAYRAYRRLKELIGR